MTYQALNDIMSLPEVQSDVIPILAMFDLALGHDPTSATLSSMVQIDPVPAGTGKRIRR